MSVCKNNSTGDTKTRNLNLDEKFRFFSRLTSRTGHFHTRQAEKAFTFYAEETSMPYIEDPFICLKMKAYSCAS